MPDFKVQPWRRVCEDTLMCMTALLAAIAAFSVEGEGIVRWEGFENPGNVRTCTNHVGDTVFTLNSVFPDLPTIWFHVLKPGKLKTLKVRLPDWAWAESNCTLTVNGDFLDLPRDRDAAGNAIIDREWKKGDHVALTLFNPVRLVDVGEGRVEVRRGDVRYVADGDTLADDVRFVARFMKSGTGELQVLDASDGRVFRPQTAAGKGNVRFRLLRTAPVAPLPLETAHLQRRIDAAAASGGGRVSIGPGVHKSGTLYLKSGVELHLEKGAVLLASDRFEDYNALDAFPQNFRVSLREGWQGRHLIVCVEQENVSLTGEGVIDGNGRAFFEDSVFQMRGSVCWRDGGLNSRDRRHAVRPGQLVEFCESRNLRVEGVGFRDPPAWTLFFHGCENVKVSRVSVEGDTRRLNTDGIDIDSCRNVEVSGCRIRTGDDAIAIRGSPARLKDKTRACEDITVKDIVAEVSACGCRVGVGTGVIRRVRVSGLNVVSAGVGFHVQSAYCGRGGVDISDVMLSDSSLRNTSIAVLVEGTAAKRPHNIRFTNVEIEETSYLPGEMIRVDKADDVLFL